MQPTLVILAAGMGSRYGGLKQLDPVDTLPPARAARAEFYIPTVVNALLRDNRATVEVLPSSADWFGVTYREDRPPPGSRRSRPLSPGPLVGHMIRTIEVLAKPSWHGRPAHETRAGCPCHMGQAAFCKRLNFLIDRRNGIIDNRPCGGRIA